MRSRQEHLLKIRKVRLDLRAAGPVHRRDLTRYLHRLEKELMEYDRLRRHPQAG